MSDDTADDGRGDAGEAGATAPRQGRRIFNDDRVHVVPARVQTFGMRVLLVTLSILFASGMIGYIFIRLRGAGMPAPGALRGEIAHPLLFVSTTIVLMASITIHLALVNIRHERPTSFLRWLLVTDFLALAFLAIQTPAMYALLTSDTGEGKSLLAPAIRDTRLYGLLFFFVLIHAAHVVGGLVYLVVVTSRAIAGHYDHEHVVGVRHAAMYWHFLDLVWLAMFGTFLVLG